MTRWSGLTLTNVVPIVSFAFVWRRLPAD